MSSDLGERKEADPVKARRQAALARVFKLPCGEGTEVHE
jgi:hypothetical protein